MRGDPQWQGDSLDFDGSGDHVDVNSLSSSVDVSEFTIAVTFEQDTVSGTNQLIEHYGGGEQWYLENDPSSDYKVNYAVNHAAGEILTVGTFQNGDRHVAVGTYDGSEYELYVDGTKIGSDSYGGTVEMGSLVIGADAPGGGFQYLDGEIYEIRLYYSKFDSEEVNAITDVMD